jgi:hypothetical protein
VVTCQSPNQLGLVTLPGIVVDPGPTVRNRHRASPRAYVSATVAEPSGASGS